MTDSDSADSVLYTAQSEGEQREIGDLLEWDPDYIASSTYNSPESSFSFHDPLTPDSTLVNQIDPAVASLADELAERFSRTPVKERWITKKSETDPAFLDAATMGVGGQPSEPSYEVRNNRRLIKKNLMIYTDDVKSCNPEEVTTNYLTKIKASAEAIKLELQTGSLYLMENDSAYYDANFKEKVDAVKPELVRFIITAEKRLKVHEDTLHEQSRANPTSADPGRAATLAIKKDRVQSYTQDVVDSMESLRNELEELAALEVRTDCDFRKLECRAEKMFNKSAQLTQDARSLCKDATEVGLAAEARTIEDAIRQLNTTGDKVDSEIQKLKEDLAVYGRNPTRMEDVTPPKFSGEEGKTDFYSFQREFEEYLDVKPMTNNESLKLLKTTCLIGPLRETCSNMKSVDEIMTHLKKTFGSPRILIDQKKREILKLGACSGSSIKKREWALQVQARLKNLHQLAKTHDLEDELYNSTLADEVCEMIPGRYLDKFRDKCREDDTDGMLKASFVFNSLINWWDEFVSGLNFDVRFDLVKKPGQAEKPTGNKPSGQSRSGFKPNNRFNPGKNNNAQKPVIAQITPAQERKCELCQGSHTHLYYCEDFQKARTGDRYKMTGQAKACFRCLRLDSDVDFQDRKAWFEKHKANCSDKWICRKGKCGAKAEARQFNMLLCGWHHSQNKSLEDDLIKDLDKKKLSQNVRFFFNTPMYSTGILKNEPIVLPDVEPDVVDHSVFLLQTIIANGQELLIFYDSGCHGAGISDRAASILTTECLRPGPTYISVAGGETIKIPGGDERFHLPLAGGKKMATITALKMPTVTHPFPVIDLADAVRDVKDDYASKHPSGDSLPDVPRYVAGRAVDIMIGIRYTKYFPRLIHQTDTGLAIYKSMFSTDGGPAVGVIGGPHPCWNTEVDSNHVSVRQYFSREATVYSDFLTFEDEVPVHRPDVGFVGKVVEERRPMKIEETMLEVMNCPNEHCEEHDQLSTDWSNVRESSDRFEDSQSVGQIAEYRCIKCRNCSSCRKGDILEKVSLQEECEQFQIEESVSLNVAEKRLIAKLPFTKDPAVHLKPNRKVAEKVLESQMRLIEKNPEMREDIVKSHQKLLYRGFVCEVDELDEEVRKSIYDTSVPGYVIPWRCVYKYSSVSTPCRVVYDASSKTPGGESLNNILAKGSNRLPRLFNILLKFRRYNHAFTADIKTAYNNTSIVPEHYRYQQYLWKDQLKQENQTKLMTVKTLIYGVRPAGNITIAGLSKLAEHCILHHPEHTDGATVLEFSTYVDDTLSAHETREQCLQAAESVRFALGLGSMEVKGFIFSGEKPNEELCGSVDTVGLVGMLWEPSVDLIGLDIKPLYFGKPRRGKLPTFVEGDISEALQGTFTKRTLLGKVAAVFDPIGLYTPISSRLRLDLHELTALKLDWDDRVPAELLPKWVKNIEDILELSSVKFRRSILHPNATDSSVDLIISADASKDIAVACVHVRSQDPNGGYYVQLLCAKSRLVGNLTIPKAELKACRMAAVLGWTVTLNFGDQIRSRIFVTDSSISLHWISNDERPLETGTRNAVIEIRRFTEPSEWNHIESSENIADLATRYVTMDEIRQGTAWQDGKQWMYMERADMPLKTIEQLTLSSEEQRIAGKESKLTGDTFASCKQIKILDQEKTSARYDYSNYVYDPTNRCWDKSVRVVALILKFVDNVMKGKQKPQKKGFTRPWSPNEAIFDEVQTRHTVLGDPGGKICVQLSEYDIQRAENYYFHLATREVKKFCKPTEFDGCEEKNQILYYTGRIIEKQEVTVVGDGFWDLTPLSFCNPVIDRHSPVGYSIVLYAHCQLAHHGNAAETVRQSRSLAFVFHVRDLAIKIRQSCHFCKRNKADLVKVEMGKIHETRLVIAPPFHFTQVDLCGPFPAICEHNHRATVQVWGAVFKDPASGAIAVHVMQSYATDSFLQAYTRFGSNHGHPKKLYIDGGGQLVKAAKDMQISVADITTTLNRKYRVGVEYQVCPPGAHNVHGVVE